jgi:hypothetical protein
MASITPPSAERDAHLKTPQEKHLEVSEEFLILIYGK